MHFSLQFSKCHQVSKESLNRKGLGTTLNNELCLSYAIKSIEVALCLAHLLSPLMKVYYVHTSIMRTPPSSGQFLTLEKIHRIVGELADLLRESLGPDGKAVMISIRSPRQTMVTKVITMIYYTIIHMKNKYSFKNALFPRPFGLRSLICVLMFHMK